MTLLEQYLDCMKRGDNIGLADLFDDHGVLHDSSLVKVTGDALHLEGKMAVEMMFHHKFGFNGGPYKIYSERFKSDDQVWYFIQYGGQIYPVAAFLTSVSEEGKIKRLNVYPL